MNHEGETEAPSTETPDEPAPKKEIILSSGVQLYLQKAFKFGNFLCGHPFTWNNTLKRAEMAPKWRQNIWRFNMILAYSHILFLIVRSIQISGDANASTNLTIYVIFMTLIFIVAGIVHLVVIANQDEIVLFTNQYIRFTKEVAKKYERTDCKTTTLTKTLEILMKSVYYSNLVMPIFMALGSIIHPESPEQISSLLQDPTNAPMLARHAYVVFIYYIDWLLHSSLVILVLTGTGFGAVAIQLITELNPETCKVTTGKLRLPLEKLRMYQGLQISVNWFHQIYCWFGIPATQFLMIIVVVLCTYGAIRMDGLQSYALAMIGVYTFTFVMYIFIFMAEVPARSSVVRQKWVQGRETQGVDPEWFQKSSEALRDIRCVMRFFYHADREMVATMWCTIVDQTVGFLVMYP